MSTTIDVSGLSKEIVATLNRIVTELKVDHKQVHTLYSIPLGTRFKFLHNHNDAYMKLYDNVDMEAIYYAHIENIIIMAEEKAKKLVVTVVDESV